MWVDRAWYVTRVGDRRDQKVPAVVEKIVKPVDPSEPEKAQITIHGADDLYRRSASKTRSKMPLVRK
jgi:hypothetical protein